ncbi:MAG: bacterio-opsin activator domain-containing protein, partial [Halapricum sp.]
WASLAAQRIETGNDAISVSVANDANEAVVALQEMGRTDCLVVDYMMPGITGLELLERIREDNPDLPVILITSEGNEDVAARAIDAGVTDYVVKDPTTDQTPLLSEKITSAVTQHRLREQIQASERRYRTVVEGSRDAIVVLAHGRVQFCNPSFADLTSRDAESWAGEDFVDEAIHRDDREQVRQTFANWHDGVFEPELLEIRLRRADETDRECECSGRPITEDGERRLLVSIRDVSERHRRKRELQWERNLNRTIQETLLESRTRATLEANVVDHVQEYGYPVAVIADPGPEGTAIRAVAGDPAFADALSLAVDEEAQGEPMAWAARSGAPQFVQDVEELFASDWRAVALEYGYRSGGAVPLKHHDVHYGVLAVYHGDPDHFSETERRLLRELGNAIAFGIHSLETENTLATDQPATAQIQVTDDAYYLADLASTGAFAACDEVVVQGTVPHGEDAIIQYLHLEGASATIQEALSDHPDVRSVAVIDDEPLRLQVTVTGPSPEETLATRGVEVDTTTIDAGGVTVEAAFQSREQVTPAVEALQEVFDGVTVRAITTTDGPTEGSEASPLDPLTARQIQSLHAAYYHGYFEQPRRRTASDIADALGIAHSTFLEHLHRAEEKYFGQHFEGE